MSKQSIAIINANVVNEGSIKQVDVLLESGRIKQVDSNITIDSKTEIIDAKGGMVFPSYCDSHTHLVFAKNPIFAFNFAGKVGNVRKLGKNLL